MVEKQFGVSLKQYNTFGIDARCRCLCGFATREDLAVLYREGVFKEKWNVISGGSNILFTEDYDGVLLHPRSSGIRVTAQDAGTVRIHAQSGVVWNDFVDFCVKNGFWGAENLSYIPGYVGAAPVQNIGAYGAEAKDIIESVELFCVDNGSAMVLAGPHCGFGYRTSVFKGVLKGRVIITGVNLILSKVPRPRLGYGDLRDTVAGVGEPTLENIARAVTAIRKSKLPEPALLGNAGSFFKNPIVEQAHAASLKKEYPEMPVYPSENDGYAKLAAGWLIDKAGWKGKKLGPAAVHDKQALVLVNLGGATGKDILSLAEAVVDSVNNKFGVELQSEVNIL